MKQNYLRRMAVRGEQIAREGIEELARLPLRIVFATAAGTGRSVGYCAVVLVAGSVGAVAGGISAVVVVSGIRHRVKS